jgi:transposase
MEAAVPPLPDNVAALKALVMSMSAELAAAKAQVSATDALIAHFKLEIAKLKREQYGPSAERSRRLLDQLEFQLEELEAAASEDDVAAEVAARTTNVTAFERQRPAKKPFPEHLPRERIVVAAPCSCPACGGARLSKLGEDVTETLEVVPRQWKVIQTVRERFACRDCETITQPPAPFHTVPRGWAGPGFVAMLLFDKYGQHQPLNRQAERFAREGVPLSLSTLADQVGAASFALMPLYRRIETHVLAAERLHGDDTTVPVLAKGETDMAGCGSMSATTDPSAALIRPPRCSTIRATGAASIHEPISITGPGSSKPTPMAAMANSMPPIVSQDPCSRQAASPMRAVNSPNLPMSRERHARRAEANGQERFIQSRCRRCSASTPCSTSNARSTG